METKELSKDELIEFLQIDQLKANTRENDQLEYKESFDWLIESEKMKCIKELTALCNAQGGYLIYGVEDSTGKIIGTTVDPSFDEAKFGDLFQNYFYPKINVKCREYSIEQKTLFVFTVQKRDAAPLVSLKSYTDPIKSKAILRDNTFYIRRFSKAEPLIGSDLYEFIRFLMNENSDERLINYHQLFSKESSLPRFICLDDEAINPYCFQIYFENKGQEAHLLNVIDMSSNNSDISWRTGGKQNVVDQNKKLEVSGCLDSTSNKHTFRLFFKDINSTIYFQDFTIENSKVEMVDIKPVESTNNEYSELISK